MKRIKNIALAGHNGSGKTSLAQALLYKAGASEKLGKAADGTPLLDFDPEEIKRKISGILCNVGFVCNRHYRRRHMDSYDF